MPLSERPVADRHAAPDTGPGLAADYLRVRQASVGLIATLEPEDCVVQTIPEVSPTKWHLAHVTWFFEQFVLPRFLGDYSVFDERYAFLFNSYYMTVGEMHARPRRGLLSRPPLRDVLAYRDHVDEAMMELIVSRPGDTELEFLVTLGLNHEQQHQELLLTDIKHVLWTNPLGPVYREVPLIERGPAVEHAFLPRPGGRFEIGARGAGFSFDNETPRHEVLVQEHAIGNRLITNGEFRAFIEDGGYGRPDLWLSDGWSQVASGGWKRPLYWSEDASREFTLSGWRAIDDSAPVCHVSFYEADAYARWAGARLPTEQEWELVTDGVPVVGNTLDDGALHPITTGIRAGGANPRSSSGSEAPLQLWGDVWEWTASPYVAYPRFRPLEGSLGEYNGKFMANQMVVRGGSCVSWADHLRASYRSFFYPHDRWQFLGLRLARDER